MKKNKKFTLIELISTIIILGLVCVIVIPTVATVLKYSNQRLYDIQIQMIEKRAEKWGINNINKLSETKILYLNLSQLLNEGYIEQTELSDPRNTKNILNGCIIIKYEETYKKYNYTYIEKKCKEINK